MVGDIHEGGGDFVWVPADRHRSGHDREESVLDRLLAAKAELGHIKEPAAAVVDEAIGWRRQ